MSQSAGVARRWASPVEVLVRQGPSISPTGLLDHRKIGRCCRARSDERLNAALAQRRRAIRARCFVEHEPPSLRWRLDRPAAACVRAAAACGAIDASSATSIDTPGWGHAEAVPGPWTGFRRRAATNWGPATDREIPDRRARDYKAAQRQRRCWCAIESASGAGAAAVREPGMIRRDEATRHAVIAVRDT